MENRITVKGERNLEEIKWGGGITETWKMFDGQTGEKRGKMR